VVQKKVTVACNDLVEISFRGFKAAGNVPVAQEIPLEILFEDEYLIAVNKRCGLVVHPGSGVHDGTLVNALAYHCKNLSDGFSCDRPGIVHRLDKDTSGVIIAAKNNQVHERLALAFMNRKVRKEYIGFCVGKTNKPSWHDRSAP
jgi:23S rRNA pseudouridine1911/1915/1917 synthase